MTTPLDAAAVVTVGTELTSGRRVDTNSAWLSRRLEALGFRVLAHHSCPDDEAAIARTLARAGDDARVVVITGGLGPTSDDLTREGAARLLGVPLEHHAPSWAAIQERFARFGRVATPSNRRQADLPQGARALENQLGTAPAFAFERGEVSYWALPGVPREMRWLWEQHLLPVLRARAPGERREWTFRTVGIAESVLGERLGAIEQEPGVEVRYAVEEALGTIEVTLLLPAADPEGPARLARLADAARAALGEHVCAEGGETLAAGLARALVERRLTVATAESCTGGRVAAFLTAIPGVSDAFLEGVVSYSNQAKTRLLGVPAALIEAHGAVSEEVARAMAAGVRERAGTDLGLGVTGIAGPGGGSAEKPVGLVHLAAARRDGRVLHLRRVFPGEREQVQVRAAAAGLDLLRRALGE